MDQLIMEFIKDEFRRIHTRIDELEKKLDVKISQVVMAKLGNIMVSAGTSLVVGVMVYLIAHLVAKP